VIIVDAAPSPAYKPVHIALRNMSSLSPGPCSCKHRRVRVDGAMGKAERQRLVLSLIGRMRLGTQQELLAALAAAGCRVTQATVSRDVSELRLSKKTDPLGQQRYVAPGRDSRHDPRTTLRSLLAQFGREATAAQNVVVVHCEIGSAPAIARALDRTSHPLVIGTLAGDDTLLVIAADADAAAQLAAELGS
jgi:transcriptional regulator of arginine metabolism